MKLLPKVRVKKSSVLPTQSAAINFQPAASYCVLGISYECC